MALVTYIEHDGREYKVDVPSGETVMQGALNNMVEGIAAECGGGLACATCHCYVDDTWIDRVGEAEGVEKEMLEAASAEVKSNSRLSCQLRPPATMPSLTVVVPDRQT